MKKVITKQYTVSFYLEDKLDCVKLCCADYDALLRDCKKWYYDKYEEGYDKPRFEIKEVVHYKSVTSLFLEKDKVHDLKQLFAAVNGLSEYYAGEGNSSKQNALRLFSDSMKNAMLDEFYHTARISDNTLWHWTDQFKLFDEQTYLYYLEGERVKQSQWAMFLMNSPRDRVVEILELVKDWNLDEQPEEYSTHFKEDFIACKSDQQFCNTLLKWTDLIRWNPDKLSLYDGSIPQPRSAHYEDEFNPEFDSDAFLD